MNRTAVRLCGVPGLLSLSGRCPLPRAQVAPPLGAAQQFGVLGGSAVTGATGSGVLVRGDVGSSPTPTISNFPPSSTVPPFTVHSSNDGVVRQAHTDAMAAYTALSIQGPGTVLPDNLGNSWSARPGHLLVCDRRGGLAGVGQPDAERHRDLCLQCGSSLTANVLSNVVGTADPCNIYWRVGSSATLNGSMFKGTVIAGASITVGAGASLTGRALAGGRHGAVTMAGSGGNTIGGCSTPGVIPVCPFISIVPPVVPIARVGVAYTQTLTASGGTAPYTFSVVSGTLPAGVTLTAGGVLAGTATTAGSSQSSSERPTPTAVSRKLRSRSCCRRRTAR